MAKSFTNKVFTFTYHDPASGWDVKLEVYPSDTTDIAKSAVLMDETIWLDWTFAYEYDKYNLGLPTAPSLKCTFNANVLNDNDFNRMIDDSFTWHNESVSLDPPTFNLGESAIHQFYAGNICKFYIDYNDDDETESGYQLMFVGEQKTGIDEGYDPNNYTYELEFIDIYRAVSEKMNTENLNKLYMLASGIVPERCYFDWVFWKYNKAWVNVSLPDGEGNIKNTDAYYFFYSLEDFWDYTELLATQVYKMLMRDSSVTMSFDLPTTWYYKQLYEGDGALGDYVTNANIYFPGHITDGETYEADIIGGALKNFYSKHKTLYDFHKAYYEGNFFHCWYKYDTDTLTMYGLLDHSAVSPRFQSWDGINLSNIKATPRVKKLDRANADLVDSKGGDISNTESITPSSESGNDYAVNICFNNFPAAVDVGGNKGFDRYMGMMSFNVTHYSNTSDANWKNQIHRNFDNHLFKFCYYEQPDTDAYHLIDDIPVSAEFITEAKFIRVHEHCKFPFSTSGDSSDDITPFSAYEPVNPVDEDGTAPDKPDAILLQRETGAGYIASQSLLHLYRSPNKMEIEATVYMPDVVHYSATTDYENPFFNPAKGYIKYTPTNLAPPNDPLFFTGYNSEFEIIKCEIDKNFNAKVTLLTKDYNL